jgi:hypothetical protein
MAGTSETSDVFFATILKYLGYTLLRVELQDERRATWIFDCASCDADILRESYDSGELALASAKVFVHEFNNLTRQQRDMRRNRQMSWASTEWINGAGK